MLTLLAACAAPLATAAALAQPDAHARPTVTIASGVIVGTTTVVPSAKATVNKYLGIPFAKSPPERFSPPVDPEKYAKPLDASVFAPTCNQQFNCRISESCSFESKDGF